MKVDIDQYRKNGFIHLRNFFSKEEVSKIYDEAKIVFYKQFVVVCGYKYTLFICMYTSFYVSKHH